MLKMRKKLNLKSYIVCFIFIGIVLSFFAFKVSAQEVEVKSAGVVSEGVSKVNSSIDGLIKLMRSALDKLAFIKGVWGKIVDVYGQIKAVLVGVWDKYLDKYLGKYVAIVRENIKQGIEEEKEEIGEILRAKPSE
ncbi:MAG: hypothetical protein Q8N55_00990 [bacterium]|nr:hypothetical protein [bacterium]